MNGGVAEVAHHQLSWRGSIRPSSRHQECAAETSQQKQKQRKKKDKTRQKKMRERERKNPSSSDDGLSECKQSNQRINLTFIFYQQGLLTRLNTIQIECEVQ